MCIYPYNITDAWPSPGELGCGEDCALVDSFSLVVESRYQECVHGWTIHGI